MTDQIRNHAQDAQGNNTSYAGHALPADRAQALKTIAGAYLCQLDPDSLPSPGEVANDITSLVKQAFAARNRYEPAATQWRIPDSLPAELVAMSMLHMYKFRNITRAGAGDNKNRGMLGICMGYGPYTGRYVTDRAQLRNLVREFNNSLCTKEMEDVLSRLEDSAEKCRADCTVHAEAKNIQTNLDSRPGKDRLVLKFKKELLERVSLDCVPSRLLFHMYRSWYKKENTDLEPYNRNLFLKSFQGCKLFL